MTVDYNHLQVEQEARTWIGVDYNLAVKVDSYWVVMLLGVVHNSIVLVDYSSAVD